MSTIPVIPSNAPSGSGPLRSATTPVPPPPVPTRRPATKPLAPGIGWPLTRGAEALQALAHRSGYPLLPNPLPALPSAVANDAAAYARWLEATASWIGVDAEPVDALHGEVTELLMGAGPAIMRLRDERVLIALVGRRGNAVLVLTPDLSVRAVPIETLRGPLCAWMELPVRAELDRLLAPMLGGGTTTERAREALLNERLANRRVGDVWLVRLPAGASFLAQARADGLVRKTVVLLGAHLMQTLLVVASWAVFGQGALEGRLERSWLLAWAALLATVVPFRLLALWTQGQVAIGAAKLMKRRLLVGALRSDPEVVRREGSGQLFGRAMEAAAIEGLALSAGFASILAILEFVVVIFVLAAGGAGPLHAALLVGFVAATLAIAWRNYKRNLAWSAHRRSMTNDLVEQMAGHRTRLAQQPPRQWHDGEDEMLEGYLVRSRAKDRGDLLALALPPLWLIVGLAGFAPAFVRGDSPGALAISLGGVLLGNQALTSLTGGLARLSAALVAWKQVAPLFHAASAPALVPSPTYVATADAIAAQGPASQVKPTLLDATDLVFAYPSRPMPVIKGGSIRIEAGERILLEGPSGGGKSTLASLIAGLRQPLSGLVLLDGLDWHTLGQDGWRRRVVAAPQYQENHVVAETFAFNLLMGREWPPEPEDLQEATEICEALGLGDLLNRMPAGLMQMVGDSGWNLSHGEKSRLYIARALLQKARLIVLDESFAALDPKTLEQCLRCVLDRAPSLVVIAHP